MKRNNAVLFGILALAALGLTSCGSAKPVESAVVKSAPAPTGTWTDPETKLMWAAKDSGYDTTWEQAGQYCSHLTAGSFHDWVLPKIEELEAISWFGENDYGYPVKGNIKLTGCCEWSSTKKGSAEAWHFRFSEGLRYSGGPGPYPGYAYGRALCVRRAGE